MKIAILGAGYVGLNTAAAFAWLGHDVRIIDKDRDRIAILEQGRSPIHEPDLEALLDQCRPRLAFSTDTAPLADAANALVLATSWPEYRKLDLKRIAEHMRQPVLVDARNFWNADIAGKAGARYVGVGSRTTHFNPLIEE